MLNLVVFVHFSLFFSFFSFFANRYLCNSKSRDRILTVFNRWMKCFSSSSIQRSSGFFTQCLSWFSIWVSSKFFFSVLMCLHFYFADFMMKKNQHWKHTRETFFIYSTAAEYFCIQWTPEVWQLCLNWQHNKSKRFKLRSHDYNYKYLRIRYDVLKWIILFAHYIRMREILYARGPFTWIQLPHWPKEHFLIHCSTFLSQTFQC